MSERNCIHLYVERRKQLIKGAGIQKCGINNQGVRQRDLEQSEIRVCGRRKEKGDERDGETGQERDLPFRAFFWDRFY
jgi:hypothetical protein